MTENQEKSCFTHRACYVNFGEHLQNAWNVNMFYPDAPNRWSIENWKSFLTMIKTFGFNCFEYWLAPTMFDRPALERGGIYGRFADRMRRVTETAHTIGLRVKVLISTNCIGPQWYFACPKNPKERISMAFSRVTWAAATGTDAITKRLLISPWKSRKS